MHLKKMWSLSSTVPHRGHRPSPGPWRLWTCTPAGSLFLTSCQRKILTFVGIRARQISITWKGAAPLCKARYRDLVVNCPEGSSFQRNESGSIEGEMVRKTLANCSHSSTSRDPRERWNCGHHYPFLQFSLTSAFRKVEIANSLGKALASGTGPSQTSNQKTVDLPFPIE